MERKNLTVHTDTDLMSLVSNYDSRNRGSNLMGIKSFTANTKMYPYADVEFDYMVGEEKIRRRGKIIGYVMTNEEVVSLVIQCQPVKSMGLRRSTLFLMRTLFNVRRVAVVERTIVDMQDGYYHFEYNVNF